MTHTLTDRDKHTLIDLLTELVAIPSVNTEAPSSQPPELAIAQYITDYLHKLHMNVERHTMPDGRPNLLAHWPTAVSQPTIALSAHMDTVDIDGMTIDPFTARISNNRIYGRGSCDTKGSLAVFLWVLDKIRQLDPPLPLDVQFLATANEENFCQGSRWLTDHNISADRMIIGEPTNCQIASAHRGMVIIKLTTLGTACHASIPQQGGNAIYAMIDAINCVRTEWLAHLTDQHHDLLDDATAAVTIVQGGHRTNIIPDRCEAMIDARVLPQHTASAIVDDLRDRLSATLSPQAVKFTVECQLARPALTTDPQGDLVTHLLTARRSLGLDAQPVGLPFITDAGNFSNQATQCVVFGPGSIAQAHRAEEYLELDQLFQAAAILLNFFLAHRH